MRLMIDAHVHIDFYDDQAKIIRGIIMEDISSIFVTHLPELYEKYKSMYENIPQIMLAIGYHPILVNEYDFNEKLFTELLSSTRFIGEVGLDFTVARSEKSRIKQQYILDKICKHSKNHILSLHSRQAEKEVFKILIENKVEHAIFHWYTGEKDFIPNIVNAGYYFSINPSMLNTNKGRSILKEIPLNKILIESDGPFSKYKGNIIEPVDLRSVYNAFEMFYGISNIEELVFNNLAAIIG